MKKTKLILINNLMFFTGWTGIMLLGADFPPPRGFIWLELLIGMLDFIQYIYLKKILFCKLFKREKIFLKNLFAFASAGVLVALLTMVLGNNGAAEIGLKDRVIWISVLTVVSTVYGNIFFCFNYFMVKKFSVK